MRKRRRKEAGDDGFERFKDETEGNLSKVRASVCRNAGWNRCTAN